MKSNEARIFFSPVHPTPRNFKSVLRPYKKYFHQNYFLRNFICGEIVFSVLVVTYLYSLKEVSVSSGLRDQNLASGSDKVHFGEGSEEKEHILSGVVQNILTTARCGIMNNIIKRANN